jgi:hypothetical protein
MIHHFLFHAELRKAEQSTQSFLTLFKKFWGGELEPVRGIIDPVALEILEAICSSR